MLSLIVNPASGGGRCGKLLPAVEAELSRHDVEHTVMRTQSLAHARELAQTAARAGHTPVAFGGDGLVGAVAGALSGLEAPFGVLPGGRGNDFARMLGLGADPVAALGAVLDGVPTPIDLGAADGRPFLGIASCGFDSEANRIANEARLIGGSLVYAYAGVRALLGWRAASFALELDGVRHRLHGYTVVVANAAFYGGGMRIAPDASLTDGCFDVVLIGDAPRAAYFANLRRVFAGTHVGLPFVEVRRARRVHVAADRPFAVYADGDPLGQLPSTFEVLPAAVSVLAPRMSLL
jgi:YegS/Rv2252/BmrU family lipid kinase